MAQLFKITDPVNPTLDDKRFVQKCRYLGCQNNKQMGVYYSTGICISLSSGAIYEKAAHFDNS